MGGCDDKERIRVSEKMGQEERIEVEKKKGGILVRPSVDNCLSMTGQGGRKKEGREGGTGEISLRCCIITTKDARRENKGEKE